MSVLEPDVKDMKLLEFWKVYGFGLWYCDASVLVLARFQWSLPEAAPGLEHRLQQPVFLGHVFS